MDFTVTKKLKPHFNIRISLKNKEKEIGYIHLTPNGEYMEILNVEVDPSFQRQGLGTKLYLKAKAEAQKAGYRGLVSDPQCRTPDAGKLWAKIPGAKRSPKGWWVLE
jgi:ribosomal protein S18 acetylase RimI-like enzyme